MNPLATLELEVPLSKITDYLLSSSHPVGRHKARYFMALGFQPERPQRLAEALKAQARSAKQVREERTAFGPKWVVSGRLKGPSETGLVVSVWVSSGSSARLVTAYPQKGLVATKK